MRLNKEHLYNVLKTFLGRDQKYDLGACVLRGYLLGLVSQGIITQADYEIYYPKT